MGRGAWQAIAHGAAETQLSEHAQKNKIVIIIIFKCTVQYVNYIHIKFQYFLK